MLSSSSLLSCDTFHVGFVMVDFHRLCKIGSHWTQLSTAKHSHVLVSQKVSARQQCMIVTYGNNIWQQERHHPILRTMTLTAPMQSFSWVIWKPLWWHKFILLSVATMESFPCVGQHQLRLQVMSGWLCYRLQWNCMSTYSSWLSRSSSSFLSTLITVIIQLKRGVSQQASGACNTSQLPPDRLVHSITNVLAQSRLWISDSTTLFQQS